MILKHSGEMEAFSEEKLANSLRRSGADEATIEFVLADVKAALFEGMSTKRIYDLAFGLLRKSKLGHAARYQIGRAHV